MRGSQDHRTISVTGALAYGQADGLVHSLALLFEPHSVLLREPRLYQQCYVWLARDACRRNVRPLYVALRPVAVGSPRVVETDSCRHSARRVDGFVLQACSAR